LKIMQSIAFSTCQTLFPLNSIAFKAFHVVDFMHLPCLKMGCCMRDNTRNLLGAILGLCQY
jgi:hypothetical protein